MNLAVGSHDGVSGGAGSGASLVRVLRGLRPACASNAGTLREALRLVDRKLPNGGIDNNNNAALSSLWKESAVACSIHPFAAKGTVETNNTEKENHDPDRNKDSNANSNSREWNLEVVSQVLSLDFAFLDWPSVGRSFDFPDFETRHGRHLEVLLALFRAGPSASAHYSFAVENWDKEEAIDASTVVVDGTLKVLQRLLHLSDDMTLHPKVRAIFAVGLLSCPEITLCALARLQPSAAWSADQVSGAGAGMPTKDDLMCELIPLFFKPNPNGRYTHTQNNMVRNMPRALCRLWSISPNMVVAACIETWRSTAGDPPQTRCATVFHIIAVVGSLPSPENAIATILNGNKDLDFSLTGAFVMDDHDMLQLRLWLTDPWNANGANTISNVGKNYLHAGPRRGKPLVGVESLGATLQLVQSLDAETMNEAVPTPSGKVVILGESVEAVVDACTSYHPSLAEVLNADGSSGAQQQQQQRPAPGSQDDIEECTIQYFQQIYSSEESAFKVVEMIKSFKASENARENDIFTYMIHNLFDERITGVLFGLLIKEQLVSSITLGIVLRYVLEALRKDPAQSPQSGKMFRFGMFALEQFKERLHEWPQFCSHIVQTPHLREGYSCLVGEIERVVANDGQHSVAGLSISTGEGLGGGGQNNHVASSGRDSGDGGGNNNALLMGEISVPTLGTERGPMPSIPIGGGGGAAGGGSGRGVGLATSSLNLRGTGPALGPTQIDPPAPAIPLQKEPLVVKPWKAVFGPGLGRAVNVPASFSADGDESSSGGGSETPPDMVLDRVQFLMNNLSMSNVEQFSHDLQEMLERKYFGWLGNYLVVNCISTQPNVHSLYLSFLDNLGVDYRRGLVEAILASVYVNVGKLLRGQKIMKITSTLNRSLLKNLGSWLGQITLARNRPILQIMLDCKELLFQGYENGRLTAVAPFVAKILEGAKNSSVFRPPNPWLMGLLSVFRALYDVDDPKMNIKFEVEALCKNLGLKLEDIPISQNADLRRRVPPLLVSAGSMTWQLKRHLGNWREYQSRAVYTQVVSEEDIDLSNNSGKRTALRMSKILTKMINGEDVTLLPTEECGSEGCLAIVDSHRTVLGLCPYSEDRAEWDNYHAKRKAASKKKRKMIPKPKLVGLSDVWTEKNLVKTLVYVFHCRRISERAESPFLSLAPRVFDACNLERFPTGFKGPLLDVNAYEMSVRIKLHLRNWPKYQYRAIFTQVEMLADIDPTTKSGRQKAHRLTKILIKMINGEEVFFREEECESDACLGIVDSHRDVLGLRPYSRDKEEWVDYHRKRRAIPKGAKGRKRKLSKIPKPKLVGPSDAWTEKNLLKMLAYLFHCRRILELAGRKQHHVPPFGKNARMSSPFNTKMAQDWAAATTIQRCFRGWIVRTWHLRNWLKHQSRAVFIQIYSMADINPSTKSGKHEARRMEKILTKMINGEDVTFLDTEECESEECLAIVDSHRSVLGLRPYSEDRTEWDDYHAKLKAASKRKRKMIPKPKLVGLIDAWTGKNLVKTLAYLFHCLRISERAGCKQPHVLPFGKNAHVSSPFNTKMAQDRAAATTIQRYFRGWIVQSKPFTNS